ncbi:hypothetical protein Pcinc_033881 [Petrolisthes cinctipes]|uniref:PDZ domain-containing protein n=1 Tax=Petrolisthes cinctipes TaxID=88211 RepID=A0AAE1ERB8_PETCI|nr:hypothetical protein Pcinc_033881 [Petrolisthes cinctipes]
MAETDVVNAGEGEGGVGDMRDGGGGSDGGGGGRDTVLRGLQRGRGWEGSEAFIQGLRAGDQVVRVNNMSVDQAVHREVTAMVQTNTSVILHIRSTGIIPLKDQSLPSCSAHESELEGYAPPPTHHHQPSHTHDSQARIYLSCTGKVGLGCSICKGPPEKPGIFVQSVRVGGVARNAGLRPGDQIIACNDVPFARLDFAEAVYVLKSSPRLTLDVIRGAGLELVAGESSGYNSSASSVAGDQTPPSSSSSDPRDSDHSVASRLNAVSRHLTIDRSRGWREIESEWAMAEAAEKRRQLQSSQKALKTRAQRDASHRISSINSRSLSNLSTAIRDEDNEEQRTAFREASFSPTYPASHHTSPLNHYNTKKHYTLHNKMHRPTLRSAKSTNDVSTEDTSHKIALVTSADPHVNNIVVSGGPKNEKDAVLRLDQLSSTSPSRSSTLSSGTSQVTVHSSSGSGSSPTQVTPSPGSALVERQLRELRREQQRLQEEANRLARERQKFEEEKRRGLERTQSDPLAPLVITCPSQALLPHHHHHHHHHHHLEPPPSPTSSISSGRHTTRVLIKSSPPPPPPRKNTTTLTSHHRGHSHPRQVSPPASPAHSSSSSSGVGSSCGSSAPPRRCKSIGSLSASSGESAVWEDTQTTPITTNPSYRSNMPPPTPPKPPAPPGTLLSSTNGAAPPPPPPPPPPPTSGPPKPNLAAALKIELEQRRVKEEQLGLNCDSSKGELLNQKIDALKKERSKTTNSQQDKLIEEIKSKHKKMFRNWESQDEETEDKQELSMPDPPKNISMPPDGKQQNEITPPRNFVLPSQNKQQTEQQNPIRNFVLPSQNKQQTEQQNPIRNFVLPSQNKQQTEQQNPIRNFVLPSQNKQQTEQQNPTRNFVLPSQNRQPSQSNPSRSFGATTPPQETVPFTSKIIKNSIANQKKEPPTPPIKRPLSASQSIATSTPSNVMQQVMAREAAATGNTNTITTINDVNNKTGIVTTTSKKLDPSPATTNTKVRSPVERQQWSERTGGDGNSTSSSTFVKPPLRPTVSSVTVMEFKPEDNITPKLQPPNTYFDMKKPASMNSGKPLVSISAYPSPNHRPAPVKMGFLPMPGNQQQVEVVNGLSGVDGTPTPSKASFQRELVSTLSRSNLGQHITSVKSSTESSSGTTNGTTQSFTTVQNNTISPKASLSNKYRGIGHGSTQVTIVTKGDSSGKENEAPESLPSGILKPTGPTAPQNKPLQKSISFGDVTTVGESDHRF